MKCIVCEENLDNTVQHSFCPTCGFPVFRAMDDDERTRRSIRQAADRCRDSWIGGAKLRIVTHKYKKTPEGLVSISDEKIPVAVCRELNNREIFWLPRPFGSIRTAKVINIELIVTNGRKKCMVSVPMRPPAATGSWHIGFTQESPGYLRMHLDDGSKIVKSGRISIHQAGIRPIDLEKPAG